MKCAAVLLAGLDATAAADILVSLLRLICAMHLRPGGTVCMLHAVLQASTAGCGTWQPTSALAAGCPDSCGAAGSQHCDSYPPGKPFGLGPPSETWSVCCFTVCMLIRKQGSPAPHLSCSAIHSLLLHVPRSPPMQPRYSIFRLFDDVLLLGKGGCVPPSPSMNMYWRLGLSA